MATWHEIYRSDLQSLWSLLVVPFGFLSYLLVSGAAAKTLGSFRSRVARFLFGYSALFAVETMLDPIVGGPVVAALGLADGFGGTLAMFLFVLLGDLRVFALFFGVGAASRGEPVGSWAPRALAYLLVVPIATGAIYGSARAAIPDVDGQVMWLVYELGFVAMVHWLARRELPRAAGGDARIAAFLRSCLGYVAAYYALWAACDVAILAGLDEGWALRIAPNQLYYALFVPFVYARSAALRAR